MPNLACRICGRVVYTSAPLESLFAEERRCPRCGGMLFADRRSDNRRKVEQRDSSSDDAARPPNGSEDGTSERRRLKRRRDDQTAF